MEASHGRAAATTKDGRSLDLARDDAGNRYTGSVEGRVAAFAEFIPTGELVMFTHTQTDPSFEGQGLASQLAYYFFLALFPALLCLIAIASFFPLQNFTDDVVRMLGPFAPREMIAIRRVSQCANGRTTKSVV